MSEAAQSSAAFQLLCPTCGDHFRAALTSCEPRRLSCAHTICGTCCDAVAVTPTPVCPICLKLLAKDGENIETVTDIGFGEFAEAAYLRAGGESDGRLASEAPTHVAGDAPTPSPAKRHHFDAEKDTVNVDPSTLPVAVTELAEAHSLHASVLATTARSAVAGAKHAIQTSYIADCAMFNDQIDDAIAALQARRRWVLSVAATEHDERLKALDSQVRCTSVRTACCRQLFTLYCVVSFDLSSSCDR